MPIEKDVGIQPVRAGRPLDPRTESVLAPAAVLIEGDKIKQVGLSSQIGVPTGAKVNNQVESDSPMMKADMIAARRIPEPVAESQFKPNTAASAVGLVTTGGTRCTILLRPITGICGLASRTLFTLLMASVSPNFFGVPTFEEHDKTHHGAQGRNNVR